MLVPFFGTANPLYAGAVVYAYGVTAAGAKDAATLVPLYTGLTGAATMVNPQTLDKNGLWPDLPYIEQATILTISGPHVSSHDSGIIEPPAYGAGKATATDLDATPSVSGVSYLVLANTAATSITTFDGAVDRQRLVVEHSTANTTLVHNAAALLLQGGIDFTPAAGTVQEFIHDGSVWREISRISP